MKVFLVLSGLLVTTLADGGAFFHAKKNPGYRSLDEPDRRCKRLGQYLFHETSDCKYLRCDYGNEPWQDSDGYISYFAQEFWCPPGRGMDRYGGGPGLHPCTVANDRCTGGFYVHVRKDYPTGSESSYYEPYESESSYSLYDDSSSYESSDSSYSSSYPYESDSGSYESYQSASDHVDESYDYTVYSRDVTGAKPY